MTVKNIFLFNTCLSKEVFCNDHQPLNGLAWWKIYQDSALWNSWILNYSF